jgi:hypothetical protein
VLEAYHAVVRGAIRALLDAVLFGHPSGLILTLAEGVAKIIGRMALLLGKRTALGIAQHVRKIRKSRLDISAVHLAMRKCHKILVIRPLITDNGLRPFAGRENHLHRLSIVNVA